MTTVPGFDSPKCLLCGKASTVVDRLVEGVSGSICHECVIQCHTALCEAEGPPPARVVPSDRVFRPQEIVESLDQWVIGQTQAKRSLAVAVYNHYKRIRHDSHDVELDKSNVLLTGPTGTGKTLLAQTLARILRVPFAMGDATSLTEAGYIGEDVESLLLRLLTAAGPQPRDPETVRRAAYGIVYIDEIDKIARKKEGLLNRDISGEGVQQALLRILEGTVAHVPLSNGSRRGPTEFVELDTRNILFIVGGSFDGLNEIIQKRLGRSGMSLRSTGAVLVKPDNQQDQINRVTGDDLIAYGLLPEFVGRLPVIASLNALTENDLSRILTEPRNGLLRQYHEYLRIDGVELLITDDGCRSIARESLNRGSGARGLRMVMEEVLSDVMFDSPADSRLKQIVVTKEQVEQRLPPTRVYCQD